MNTHTMYGGMLTYAEIPQNVAGDKIMRVDFIYNPFRKIAYSTALIEPQGDEQAKSVTLSVIEMDDVFHFGLPGTYPNVNEYATFTFNKKTHKMVAFEPIPLKKPDHLPKTSLYDYLKGVGL